LKKRPGRPRADALSKVRFAIARWKYQRYLEWLQKRQRSSGLEGWAAVQTNVCWPNFNSVPLTAPLIGHRRRPCRAKENPRPMGIKGRGQSGVDVPVNLERLGQILSPGFRAARRNTSKDGRTITALGLDQSSIRMRVASKVKPLRLPALALHLDDVDRR
jgi:hypothetical protein